MNTALTIVQHFMNESIKQEKIAYNTNLIRIFVQNDGTFVAEKGKRRLPEVANSALIYRIPALSPYKRG